MSRLRIPVVALEPSVWGTLPKELLHLVFARLPVARIGQLRVLSKEWKRNVDCKDSEFNQVLDATAHLNMFALLEMLFADGGVVVSGHIYDVQADKWHVYETERVLREIKTSDGVDGGLVCVLERTYGDNELGIFIVMNPLTKQKMQLPPLLCMGAEKSNTLVIRMVKLTMDRKTEEYRYKVFVVGNIRNAVGGRGFFAEVYDSHIKEWTVVEATQGHIIGWDHYYSMFHSKSPGSICVYNCVDGTLQHFFETDIAPGLEVELGCCVLLEDHLFVLHKEASPGPADPLEDGESMLAKYFISEFHFPENSTAWVKLGVRSCGPFKCLFRERAHNIIIKWRLWGCNGFLLLYGDCSNGGCLKRAWLYNLSTCEWRYLPAYKMALYPKLMCTLSWSAMA